ncbi:MAG: hemolysin XhlA family protein [Sarcina sp.]
MNEEKLEIILQDHKERIIKNEDNINKLEEKISDQITEMAETRNDLKNLCKSVDSLTSMMKYLCMTLAGFLLGFFVWMIQNHFVIH